MRDSFHKHIRTLELRVAAMGKQVEEAIQSSMQAMKDRNIEQAEKVIKNDALINTQRWQIEEECVNLIALQQPVASDLREMIAILNIVTDLERMGDHAEGVAKIVKLLGKEDPVKPLTDIPVMSEIAVDMLRKSIDAFIRRDAKIAEVVCAMDDKVDQLNDKVYHELIDKMLADPKVVTRATYQIWAAHNLERIADRVTNICERVVYLVTGSMHKLPSISKY